MNDNFVGHLIELRSRLLKSLLGFVIAILVLLPFANDIYSFLASPLLQNLPDGGQMIATGVTTPFLVPLKVVMFTAFVISAPHTLYQIWAFIAPALYSNEKHLIAPLVLLSVFLFLAGIAFAYFLVFPVVFGFIANTGPEGVAIMTDISNYLDFSIAVFIAFSLAFQVPIAVILMVTTGVVDAEALRRARPYIIVAAFVLGAVITPPDVISQFMLAVPVWLLYEAGIVLSGVLYKKAHAETTKENLD